MAEQAYAYVTLIPVAKGFQSAVAKQLSGVGGAGGTVGKETGKNFASGFGGALKGLAAVAGTALAAAGVGKFFTNSIKQASDLNESINAVNVAFTANAEGVRQLGKEAATSLGLSTQEFNQLAVGFTAFTEKIAGPGGDVVKILDDLTTRGSDFASVMNLEVSEALTLFRSGLSGETEPLRRFGIDVSEATVKTFAYANGIAETGTQLTETQKVQARYGAIMEQTARMQGDFANTSDQLANSTRIVKAQFKDLQAEIGSALLPALQDLMPALIPIVEKAAPLLVRILEAAIPVVESLTDNLGPLFDSLEPLIEVFAMVAEAVAQVLSDALPPLIEVLSILTPVILSVAQAFLPLIQKLLPPFIALIESMLPLVQMAADIFIEYFLPVLEHLAELLGGALAWGMDLFTRMFQDLATILGPVYEFLKPVLEGLLALAGIKPTSLQKEVVVTTNYRTVGTPTVDTEVWDIMGAKNTPLPSTAIASAITTGATGPTAAEMREQLKGYIEDTKKALIENRQEYNNAIKEANRDYAKAQIEIAETYDQAILAATTRRNEQMAENLKSYNASIEEINLRSAEELAKIISDSMARLTDAYRAATEIDIAEIFSSEAVNKNLDNLIASMQERLAKSKELTANAAALVGAGFSQTFVEQVVAAGADVGNEMAQAILNSTPQQQKEIQDLFTAIETEANTGMDALAQTLYEKNGLATQELKGMYEQVLIDQAESLAEQKRIYDETITEIMDTMYAEIAEAKSARDEALLDAENALNEALLKANQDFLKGLDKIDEAFKKKIAGMKGAVSGLKSDIDSLNAAINRAQSRTATTITGLEALTPFAKGGLVTGPTAALIGEAGPELVIPLDRVESMMGGINSGKTVNYYAAPNQSIDSEQELFQAMRRAKVVANW